MNAAPIYEHPEIYDLEHTDGGDDIAYFLRRAGQLRPRRVLELGCGSGRISCPLAKYISSWGGSLTGLDASEEMLTAARAKPNAELVNWQKGDFRDWQGDGPFDWIISPCSSLSHLLHLQDRLAAWRNARSNLLPNGLFTVVENMPNYFNLADSMHQPPRLHLMLDGDSDESETGARLLRYRATKYDAVEQNSTVHYLYDHFAAQQEQAERLISVQSSHVYFPCELQLLFLASGFNIREILGEWTGLPISHASRQLIITGVATE